MKKCLFGLTALLLLALLCYSGGQVVYSVRTYHRESRLKAQMLAPPPPSRLKQAQERNPDVAGWITIPGTGVDYPFVHTENNSDYLRRDLDGEYALAGTIFLDSRCKTGFSGKAILYGHNMKNGGMFGDLPKYTDPDFLAEHSTLEIQVAEEILHYQIYACRPVEPDDPEMYALPSEESGLLILSTCLDDQGEKRLVVLARQMDTGKKD